MKILSLIVPSYNSEKYLDKVMVSFLHPEILDSLEIIIVNDGSTDATPRLAKKYCDAYPDTVRLINQENRGHGGALNTGCQAARGKYLKIVDADDWVERDNLPEFVRRLDTLDSDVVLTHHYTRDVSTGQVKRWMSYPPRAGETYTLAQIMPQWKNFDRSLTFHGITYRTAFYRECGIELSEHVFYEDHEFATIPCCYAKTITPLDLFIYDYRIGDQSQSVSEANQLKRLHHTETVLNRLLEEYNKLTLPGDSAGRIYYARKAQGLLLSYITNVMLLEPDRKKGRALGKDMMERFRRKLPESYQMAKKQYWIFCAMNRLHITKNRWDRVLSSPMYNHLRHNHPFN